MTRMRRDEQRRDSGEPGGGQGRKDEVGRTGIWPASGPLPPGSDVTVVGQAELGQGVRGAAGYDDSGGSALIVFRTDPVCGAGVNPKYAAATTEYKDTTYYFDSADCQRQFEQAPDRYASEGQS
jgi:YHS domain-containing protein